MLVGLRMQKVKRKLNGTPVLVILNNTICWDVMLCNAEFECQIKQLM